MGLVTDENSQGLSIAVLTVSDTRTRENDTSGDYLVKALEEAGHHMGSRTIVRDDIYQIRAVLSALIADVGINAVLMTAQWAWEVSGRSTHSFAHDWAYAIVKHACAATCS